MTDQSDIRESPITALNTWTPLDDYGAATPGRMQIPEDARRITEILISVGIDWAATADLSFNSAVRLTGALRGKQEYLGAMGFHKGVITNSVLIAHAQPARYLVDIPVEAGGDILAEGIMLGEDAGGLNMGVQVVYDGPVFGQIKSMEFREDVITVVNSPTTLDGHGDLDPEAAGIKSQGLKRLVAIAFGVAGNLAGASTVGNLQSVDLGRSTNLQRGGFYRYLGPAGSVMENGTAVDEDSEVYLPTVHERDIPVMNTGECIIEAQLLEELGFTNGFAVCALGFGD